MATLDYLDTDSQALGGGLVHSFRLERESSCLGERALSAGEDSNTTSSPDELEEMSVVMVLSLSRLSVEVFASSDTESTADAIPPSASAAAIVCALMSALRL